MTTLQDTTTPLLMFSSATVSTVVIMPCDGKPKVSEEERCADGHDEQEFEKEAITCSALCSLGSTDHRMPQQEQCESLCFGDDDDSDLPCSANKATRKLPLTSASKCCTKQLQLPMFLSSKYHTVANQY